jgi:hypothetical protein
MQNEQKTLSYREALYIYSSLATKSNNLPVKKIKECYNIGEYELRSFVDKCIAEEAALNSKRYNTTFNESFESISLKQRGLARHNLIEEEKLKWIHSLSRQESFMLDRLLQDEVYSLKISPQISGIRGQLIDHDKLNLDLLEQAKDDEDKKFLQFKSIFIIDNLMGSNKDTVINTLHKLKKKIKQVERVTSWYGKEAEASKNTFIDWFSTYIYKNPVPEADKFRTDTPLPLNAEPFLPELQRPKYDTDFWLFSFSVNHTPDNGNLELYLRAMKGAWSQKKYRDSNNGRKACNFHLQERHIKLLEKLAKHNRRKKNEMLEILIEDACEDAEIVKKPNRR